MPAATLAAEVVRRPVVGVMGSSQEAHAGRAGEVGRWIAAQGYHLLTGGGGGVMGAVSAAFAGAPGRRGMVLGILPCGAGPGAGPPAGYPNPWVEIPIVTHLDALGTAGDTPRSRNHLNVLSATVVILLPGGPGTASEARLALRYGRPAVAYLRSAAELPGLPDGIPVEAGFERVAAFVARHAGAVS